MTGLGSGDDSLPTGRGQGGAVLAWLPALLWLVMTFYVGSLHRDPLGAVQFELKDKILHALFFGIMQRTHFRALEFALPRKAPRSLNWWACLSATAIGILLEVWQSFLPHRSADVWDAVADALGAALFAWGFSRLGKSP